MNNWLNLIKMKRGYSKISWQ